MEVSHVLPTLMLLLPPKPMVMSSTSPNKKNKSNLWPLAWTDSVSLGVDLVASDGGLVFIENFLMSYVFLFFCHWFYFNQSLSFRFKKGFGDGGYEFGVIANGFMHFLFFSSWSSNLEEESSKSHHRKCSMVHKCGARKCWSKSFQVIWSLLQQSKLSHRIEVPTWTFFRFDKQVGARKNHVATTSIKNAFMK